MCTEYSWQLCLSAYPEPCLQPPHGNQGGPEVAMIGSPITGNVLGIVSVTSQRNVLMATEDNSVDDGPRGLSGQPGNPPGW
ncbi:hypothetical protein Hamer_G023494 [Homarus americanus]|uniref:Uncharacterized protein n=1 Tax=Homarus americanus TaxID=6706 RepID=A0A8J5MRD4_HOMAM|nr:hypothetical protein Hamer_G023494 [Homarus americanus]